MSPRGAHPFSLSTSVANRFQRPHAVCLVPAGRRHDATARVGRDGDLMDVVAVLSTRGPAAPETASAAEAHPAGRSRS